MSESGLRVEALCAGYGKGLVLRDLMLHADSGECIALLGPNGVGKTTAIRAISGLVKPRSGSISWQGTSLVGKQPHQIVRLGIAVVPEGRRLYGGMTVEDNLLMGAYSSRKEEALERLVEIRSAFPLLTERSSQLAGSLSGGQQQLCAIARALMSSPRLLLVDELSLGLSPAAIKEVLEGIRIAQKLFSPTIVVVDQDVHVAAQLASRGYFLDLGAVAAEGPMEMLVEADLIRDLYFRKEVRVEA